MRQALFLAVLFLSSWAMGQECTTYVLVDVRDRHLGIDVETLKAADFEARLDGATLPIISSELNFNNRLLVLVETDGAANNSKIGDVVDTVTRQARQAPDGKPLAFGVYAEHALFTNGFIADPHKRNLEIGEVIEKAPSLGKRVAMYEALHQALHLFGEHQPGDTVLLVADPYDDRSGRGPGDIEKEFLASGTRLLVMLRQPLSRVGRDFTWNPHTIEKQFFAQVPERTGGAYNDFDPHFFGWASKGYMLGVKLPDNRHKPRRWKIRLHGEAGANFEKATLFYPQQSTPCQTTAAAGIH